MIDLYTPEMNIVELKELSALNFTNRQILPHYSRFLNRYDAFEERCSKYEKESRSTVIRLNDGEGVFIDENNSFIVRKNKFRCASIEKL